MSNQFIRQYYLQIGQKRFETDETGEGLNLSFAIDHAFSISPNNAEIELYNCSSETREYLESAGVVGVRLDAGYVGNINTIFRGALRQADSDHDGPNWITRLSCGDGEVEYLDSKISKSWSRGTPVATILPSLVEKTGLLLGNTALVAPLAQMRKLKKNPQDGKAKVVSETPVLTGPYALSGKAFEQMEKFMKATNLRWTSYGGAFRGGKRGTPSVIGEPYILSPETGLIGSPKVETVREELGEFTVISGAARLIPGLEIGMAATLISRRYTGPIVIHSTRHVGELNGDDWNVEFSAEPLEEFL